ncbi:DUF4139 domain-containing protein [Novosphingobium sp. JCM 18896]|uniref:DUF4139 domain-containing protein n=1 Tax=Novosphingobium sp. JCM 18896 TaxID=2989731 RepID=UPI002221C081|nr:hypothetical protein [Novosphingobium sp. JCM 18896]
MEGCHPLRGGDTPPSALRAATSPCRGGSFLLALLLATPALAEPPVVQSDAPDTVAVTLYRDPDRGDGAIDRNRPSSFALISETRTVTLPPGEVTVRFEGVASGIVPQSAILFGTDPRERNRDAALLSQKGLVDAFTGQGVILRRTDPATGTTVEEPATIRSAADRLVVTTPRGTEAVYCSGLKQTLIYPQAPATLSAKPVLSMLTKDQPGGRVTITLAYIATGFDWDATYVGTLAPDGKSLELLGWMTMASGDDTSFVDATTAAVAGKINRSDTTRDDSGARIKAEASSLYKQAQCWPMGNTSSGLNPPPPPPPPPPPAAPMMMEMAAGNIVVTARRREEKAAVVAEAEGLGDLKLYRIPVPVTVAARSHKQVAFLVKDAVRGETIYRTVIDEGPSPIDKLFRFRNRKDNGLGDPLPAGKAVLYQEGEHGRGLIGEASTPDKAMNEEVELAFARAGDVTIETREPASAKAPHVLTIRNANPFAVTFEAEFHNLGRTYRGLPSGLIAKPGKRVWRRTIPANETVQLSYRVD